MHKECTKQTSLLLQRTIQVYSHRSEMQVLSQHSIFQQNKACTMMQLVLKRILEYKCQKGKRVLLSCKNILKDTKRNVGFWKNCCTKSRWHNQRQNLVMMLFESHY